MNRFDLFLIKRVATLKTKLLHHSWFCENYNSYSAIPAALLIKINCSPSREGPISTIFWRLHSHRCGQYDEGRKKKVTSAGKHIILENTQYPETANNCQTYHIPFEQIAGNLCYLICHKTGCNSITSRWRR